MKKYFIITLLFFYSLNCFDYIYYLNKYPELRKSGIYGIEQALKHYITIGKLQGKTGVANIIEPTNFDWKFYVERNNLPITDEPQALKHYHQYGYFDKLPYCKSFTIIILLHLHNIEFIDEFIEKINHFIKINDKNTYHIKINIPIDATIYKFEKSIPLNLSESALLEEAYATTPFHRDQINATNSKKLIEIKRYLSNNLNISKNNIQTIFSENKGYDIGSFFLMLDQVIKQNIKHDFIIKLHTKKNKIWRDLLTSFLNIPVNKLLNNFETVYSNRVYFDFNEDFHYDPTGFQEKNKEHVQNLCRYFNVPAHNFNFAGGTMFIASNKITKFFQSYDPLKIFNLFEKHHYQDNGLLEHGFERFFGCLFEHLNMKHHTLDYYPQLYIHDQKISKTPLLSTSSTRRIRKLIDTNNIKPMAIYFPQFHKVKENNNFWGPGFTEWTLMNNFTGEIKKPHIDLGQYNILDYHTRRKQACIAKEHGIKAFCYYHYWFKDKKVMHKGLEKILEDNEPNIPFLFCWANEPWTRNWDGLESQTLIAQEYGSRDDWLKHYKYLLQFFKHPNYIKEDNCPILYIYRLEHIAKNNALEMLKLWKEKIIEDGFSGLKIIAMLGYFNNNIPETKSIIDGFAEHQPTFNIKNHSKEAFMFMNNKQGNLDAQKFYQEILRNNKISNNYTRGIFFSWDNSSRRINALSAKFINLSYTAFENFLINTIKKIAQNPNANTNYILINAWNEWTEQAMIEPNNFDNYELLKIIKKYFG